MAKNYDNEDNKALDKSLVEFTEGLSSDSFMNSLLFNLFGAKPAGVYYDINAEVLKKQVQKDLDSFNISVPLKNIEFEKEKYPEDDKLGFSIVVWFDRNSKHISYQSDDSNSIYSEKPLPLASRELKAVIDKYCDESIKKKPIFNSANDPNIRAIKISDVKFFEHHFDANNRIFEKHFAGKTSIEKDIYISPRFDKQTGNFISCRVTVEKPRKNVGERKTNKQFKIGY
jgi:hypothetical protein